MEEVVPWAPFTTNDDAFVVGPRVLDAPYDQSLGHPAYDRIVLAPEGGDSS